MQVILLEDVKGIGKAGAVAKVNDGHARNLLIPRGLAKEATDANIRALKKEKELIETKRAEELVAAKLQKEMLEKMVLTLKTKAGEGGRLFGAITSKDIAEELKKQTGVEIDKRKFVLETPIKHTGETIIEVKLYTDVVAKCRVNVVI